MKHENLFKIYIPEPCHEDWAKMTPEKQGAFCKVCAKTVVDFSEKSNEEVNEFLLANMEKKICGRFRTTQLADVPPLKNEIKKFEFPGFLFPLNYSPARTYALALMLFASAALAGCSNSEGKYAGDKDSVNIEHIAGGFEIRPEDKHVTVTDSSKTDMNDDMDVVGKLQYIPPVDTALKIDTTTDIRMLGEICVPDTTQKPQQHKTMGIIKKTENKNKEYLKGGVEVKR
jgi:hypothetical protein